MASKTTHVRSVTVRGVAGSPLTLEDLRDLLAEADENDYPGSAVVTTQPVSGDPHWHRTVTTLTIGADL